MHVDKRRLIEVDILYYAIQINSILRLHLSQLASSLVYTIPNYFCLYVHALYPQGPSPIKGREAILRTHEDPPSAS